VTAPVPDHAALPVAELRRMLDAPLVSMERRKLLSDIAYILAPLVGSGREHIDMVRFVGTRTDLTALATDGHVLAQVVCVGDYSDVGDCVALASEVLKTEAYETPGAEFPAKPVNFVAPPEGALAVQNYLRITADKPNTARRVQGWWLGPAMKTTAEVVDRFARPVAITGNASPDHAIRLDSIPGQVRGHEVDDVWGWLTVVVMPARGE
jgi:hypothetical protein